MLGCTIDVIGLELGSLPGQRTMNFHIFLSSNNIFYMLNFVKKIILFFA